MGLGYIGLPTAIVAADNGIGVIGVDVNPKVVEIINQGKIHIMEPGLEELAAEVVNNGWLKAHSEPEVCDVYLIAVPTPLSKENLLNVLIHPGSPSSYTLILIDLFSISK